MIKTVQEWVGSTREVSLLPKSPLEQKDGRWAVAQRMEAWQATGPRIFDEHLDRFRRLAVGVLRERDPQFDLEPDRRFAARLYEKVLTHSDELRSGIAETLALLGSFPQFLTSCSQGKAESTAASAVREILSDADWTVWGSVNRHLPMLAEAAPEEFLRAVENGAAQDPSPFSEIYAQESSGVMGRNYLTGLLWALETLAWHPDYLTRVVVLLGELAAKDPGGNWSNRPSNSLTEILLPWHPQTCADVQKRKTAVITLMKEHPAVGWTLLLSLLPKTHGVASGTRKPKWRNFIPENGVEPVTRNEYQEQVGIYAQLAIEAAIEDLTKLTELIQRLPNLPDTAHSRLLELLASEKITNLPESERRPLWDALENLIATHRKFAEAEWAMSAAAIAKIQNVSSKLAPKSPMLLHGRLFGGRDYQLFDEKGDYEKQRRKLDAKREEAVNEIIGSAGIAGILEFARSVASPGHAGFALGVVGNAEADPAVLPNYLSSSEPAAERIAGGFIAGRFHAHGWEWVDKLALTNWTPEQTSAFLAWLPFNRKTWTHAKRLLGGDEALYWAKTSANQYQAAAEDLLLAVEGLLQYGRPGAALQCLSRLIHEKQPTPPDLVIRTLQASLVSEEPANALDQHTMIELINWLQTNPETDSEKLFHIEWSYLPLLDRYSGGSPKTLTQRLSQDPDFFCTLIRTVFKSEAKKETTGKEPTQKEKESAENAYRLLFDWHRPPGVLKGGGFDEAAFAQWLAAVKDSTEKSGHLDVAMSQVGQVLAYSPPDPDGLWIHKAVAAALNQKDADYIRSGFKCELFNMRGTHGFTGGKQEKEIASQYRERADAVEAAGFHRLAISLREVALSYEHDAERDEKRGPLG